MLIANKLKMGVLVLALTLGGHVAMACQQSESVEPTTAVQSDSQQNSNS